MKQLLLFFWTLLLAGMLVGCNDEVANPIDDQHEDFVPTGGSGPIQLRSALVPQAGRDNDFALKLFKRMAAGNSDSNIVVSPMSISIALGMAWNGAANTTRDEMSDLLGMNGFADSLVNQYYEVMQKSLPVVDSSTTVNLANSLWYTKNFVVKPAYLKVNQDFFDAEIRSLDFQLPSAKDTINAWVDAKTDHLIPTIVENTAGKVMYLINAVYFKGFWVKPFNPDHTYQTTFHLASGGTKQVKMMSMIDTMRFGETSNAQYLDLPYGNGTYSMTLVLPKSGFGTNDVLNSLTNATWKSALESLATRTVQVNMPRFKLECAFDLVPTLKSLGMKQAFTELADFSGISVNPVLISEVKHKTYVEVTEKGTKAAAVTSIGMVTSIGPSFPQFIADKPFLFFIRENGSGVILFAGKVGSVTLF